MGHGRILIGKRAAASITMHVQELRTEPPVVREPEHLR